LKIENWKLKIGKRKNEERETGNGRGKGEGKSGLKECGQFII
jgi:hypothetical protein